MLLHLKVILEETMEKGRTFLLRLMVVRSTKIKGKGRAARLHLKVIRRAKKLEKNKERENSKLKPITLPCGRKTRSKRG